MPDGVIALLALFYDASTYDKYCRISRLIPYPQMLVVFTLS